MKPHVEGDPGSGEGGANWPDLGGGSGEEDGGGS